MQHLDDGSLQAWLDRSRSGMDEAERAEIERHLAECAECSERLAEFDEMTARLRALLPAVEPPSGDVPDWEAVVARAREHRKAGTRRPVWTAVGWAAGIAAVMGVGWLSNDLYRSMETARQATPGVAEASGEAPPARTPAEAGPEAGPEAVVDPGTPTEARVADAPVAAETPTERVAEALPRPARPLEDVPIAPTAFEVERPGAPTVAAAPPPAVLRGRVTDESGVPLADAQVFIRGTGVGALTNEDGVFALSLPDTTTGPEGRDVVLTAQRIGYGEANRELIARAGDTVSADLRMVEQAVALEALVITGTTVEERAAQSPRPGLELPSADPLRGGSWTPVNRADAELRVGFPLLLVADLPLVAVEIGSVEGETLARITQELEDGGRLTLIEAGTEVSLREGSSGASTRRGDVWITATAPIPVDSLAALLRRLR